MKVRGAIVRFRGKYRFLSNFYPCAVTYKGFSYPSSEHAFQAAKAVLRTDHDRISSANSPSKAKFLGKTVRLRDDWEKVKVHIMLDILKAKFTGNFELASLLAATDSMLLVEGNEWHDNFWGVCLCRKCSGCGKNMLGRELMYIRDELL